MLIKMKGGTNIKMETKSRYEVISNLEAEKRKMIVAREGLNDKLRQMKKELVESEREVEDLKESITDFESTMKEQKETYNQLIQSIDESLTRFGKLDK
jgi:soluble cytochrome b562